MAIVKQPGLIGAIVHPQSYANILYLLLGLPLGTAYFIVLVTGISLGFGLVVIWVGVPILLLVFAMSRALCQFERQIAITLLKEDIPPTTRTEQRREDGQSLSPEERLFLRAWRQLRRHLASRLTWTGMLYLFLRFPLGIGTFTAAVTLISVSIGMIFAPAYMWASDPFEFSWIGLGDRTVDPFPWSWILTIIGIPALFVSIYLMNAIAFATGRFASLMLAATRDANIESDESEIEEPVLQEMAA